MKFKELLRVCAGENIKLLEVEMVCPADENICEGCEHYDAETGCTTEWVKEAHLIFEGRVEDAPIKVAEYKINRIMAQNTRIRANYFTSHLCVEVQGEPQ